MKPLAEVKSNFSNNSSEKDTIFENNINIKVNITVSQQTHAKNSKVFANELQKNIGKFNNYVPVKRNLNENREKNNNNSHLKKKNTLNSNNNNEKIANKNKTLVNFNNNINNNAGNVSNKAKSLSIASQHKNNFQGNLNKNLNNEKKEEGGA